MSAGSGLNSLASQVALALPPNFDSYLIGFVPPLTRSQAFQSDLSELAKIRSAFWPTSAVAWNTSSFPECVLLFRPQISSIAALASAFSLQLTHLLRSCPRSKIQSLPPAPSSLHCRSLSPRRPGQTAQKAPAKDRTGPRMSFPKHALRTGLYACLAGCSNWQSWGDYSWPASCYKAAALSRLESLCS